MSKVTVTLYYDNGNVIKKDYNIFNPNKFIEYIEAYNPEKENKIDNNFN